MHKTEKKSILIRMYSSMGSFVGYLKKHAGQIGYYACVALVLAAVAVAAEQLRVKPQAQEPLMIPAAEIKTPVQETALFECPAGMKVIRGYAEHPEWNEALGHWETHTATDYMCEDGSVRSFSDGKIATIGVGGIYGGFIDVKTDAYILRYASMELSDDIAPGKAIRKGEVLGTADDSMPGEAYMDKHLHLELYRDGRHLDIEKECDKKVPVFD